MPTPVTPRVDERWTRCGRCGKPIAHQLGPGSRIDCPKCGADNRA